MWEDSNEAIGILLGAGDPGDWTALLDRVGDQLAPALRYAGPVDALVDAAIATRRPAYLEAVAWQNQIFRQRPELVERLANGDYPVGLAVYSRGCLSEPRLRRQLLAAAHPTTPGWTGPDGLVTGLLTDPHYDHLLRPAVVCAFPELVRLALVTFGPRLTHAEQLHGLLSLYTHAGPDAVLATVESAELSADVVALAREAAGAADGESRLRAATEEAESTTTLIDELYRVDSGKRRPHSGGPKSTLLSAADLVNARTEIDWPALVAAHTRQPFGKESTVMPLAERSDCPPEMLAALLSTPPKVTSPSRWAEVVGNAALRQGLPGADLLEVARLAKGVLDVSRNSGGPGWAEFRAALETLVHDRLGDNVLAWRALRARLVNHPGTIPELIDESLAAAATASPHAPWPDAGDLPDPSRSGDLPIVRSAFLSLLDAAPTKAHLALLSHLDDRTAHDLVVAGSWKPELAEHLATAGSPRDQLVLARRKDLTPDWIVRLHAWDEPKVNTSLFFQGKATRRQKLAILAGVPAGANRVDQVPLPQALRSYLLSKRNNNWTTELSLGCGDPQVLRHVLRYAGVKAGLGRLRMFAGLWRRHGPDEVRALLTEDFSTVKGQRTKKFDPELRTLLDELLALPDETVALDRLRAHTLIALLREGISEDIVAVELPSWDWATVLAAHRQRPFDPAALTWLAGRTGCPAELTGPLAKAENTSADASGGTAMPSMDRADPPPLTDSATSGSAPPPSGLPDQIRDLAVLPARDALSALPRQLTGPERQAVADILTPLKGDLEAWVLLLRMVSDFPGTLPELVSTVERTLR